MSYMVAADAKPPVLWDSRPSTKDEVTESHWYLTVNACQHLVNKPIGHSQHRNTRPEVPNVQESAISRAAWAHAAHHCGSDNTDCETV